MQIILLIKWCDLVRLVHENFPEKGNPGRMGPGRRHGTPRAYLKRKQVKKTNIY